jgi:hypothetical protein
MFWPNDVTINRRLNDVWSTDLQPNDVVSPKSIFYEQGCNLYLLIPVHDSLLRVGYNLAYKYWIDGNNYYNLLQYVSNYSY